MAGLLLLLAAALNSQAGKGHPSRYFGLARAEGTVVGFSSSGGPWAFLTGSPGSVVVLLDRADGNSPLALEDPELRGARDRLLALPRGVRISVAYDPRTNRIWQMTRSDGGPGIGDFDLQDWRAADQRAGRRRAMWLAAAGVAVLGYGVFSLVRAERAPPSRRAA